MMHTRSGKLRVGLGAFLIASTAVGHVPARAGEIEATAAMVAGLGEVRLPVVSIREARFRNVTQQKTDFSCGAAAVSTILRYAYGLDATEESVLSGMFAISDPEAVRSRGFSLLDIKRYVQSIGLSGIGYRLTISQLAKVRVPSIIVLNSDGYEHFVVFKKLAEGFVYVADPALGNRAIAVEQFRDAWNSVMFTIAGSQYRAGNALLDVQPAESVEAFMNGLPRLADPLSNLTLMSIGVLPTNRL